MGEYMKRLGVNMDTLVPKPQGEFGPGGVKPTVGVPGATATPTAAPSPYSLPERTPIGNATTAPAGYDYNNNTGEFVRKDVPGFINGQQVPGTVPALAQNVPMGGGEVRPTDVLPLYRPGQPNLGTYPQAPVAPNGGGSPFDQFIRGIIPSAQPGAPRVPGTRGDYVPPQI